MTTIGLKLDRWACDTLAKFGVRTPLFTELVTNPETGRYLLYRNFAICSKCHRVFPHWWGNLTAKEIEKRGFAGCRCGGIRLDVGLIPGWKACLWMAYGLIWRRLIRRQRLWDPRVPVREVNLD